MQCLHFPFSDRDEFKNNGNDNNNNNYYYNHYNITICVPLFGFYIIRPNTTLLRTKIQLFRPLKNKLISTIKDYETHI